MNRAFDALGDLPDIGQALIAVADELAADPDLEDDELDEEPAPLLIRLGEGVRTF